ncbi:hypothetical protein [Sporohalobacter salinus]|uniref:hypothetical protein n=1 Tax=Sporohalobacter salinus TaxID=1494606 RepID=UPI001960C657|nr:hypothetical protein [Sporohalobacter salinus]MBM7624813.1 hypothetical protein [Sporohalobacter salinus]
MKFKGIRLEFVAVALVISLVAFFGVNYYMENYRTETLLNEDLSSFTEVEKIEITNLDKKKEISISLNQVDNLQKLYQKINSLLSSSLGSGNYIIKLENSDNKKLMTAYQKIHLSVYESIITGRFTDLGTKLNELEDRLELESAEVSVDENNIYLKLSDSEDEFYKVIKRSYPAEEVALQGGEGNG